VYPVACPSRKVRVRGYTTPARADLPGYTATIRVQGYPLPRGVHQLCNTRVYIASVYLARGVGLPSRTMEETVNPEAHALAGAGTTRQGYTNPKYSTSALERPSTRVHPPSRSKSGGYTETTTPALTHERSEKSLRPPH